jgi:hypothetical protein
MHYGDWPVGDVDHINMDKTDKPRLKSSLTSRRDNMNNITTTKANKVVLLVFIGPKREGRWVSGITMIINFII